MSAQIIELHPYAIASEAALVIERVEADGLAASTEALRNLARRALERNVFYEPDFLLPAARHLSGPRTAFVLIWQVARPAKRRLVGFFPLTMPRFERRGSLIRGWSHPYMVNGAPLLDMSLAGDVLEVFDAWVGRQECSGVLFPALALDGPFAALVTTKAARQTTAHKAGAVRLFDEHRRAVLRHGPSAEDFLSKTHSPKKSKEWRRLRARLAEQGQLETVSFRDPAGVREAFEEFLALEAQGWKGRGGSGMQQSRSVAAFARQAMRSLAAAGQCRIDMMRLDGKPIAAAILLESGDKAFYWKTAYDEKWARFSPGLQVTLDLTRHQLRDAAVRETDSCAVAGHPMIDPLWPERLRVGDLFVGAPAGGLALTAETWRRRLRAFAKRAVARVKGPTG